MGLKENTSLGTSRLRLRRALLAGQVGLSLVLVVIAALLCRSLVNLYRIDLGIDTKHILLVTIRPEQSLTGDLSRKEMLGAACQKIAGIPGVRSAAVANRTLLEGSWWDPDVTIPGRPPIEQRRRTAALIVSNGYFEPMGIKLLAGRVFRASETQDSTRVAVVNQAFADLYFPDESPLDQFVTADEQHWQIVGLCSNHRYQSIRWGPPPILYIPHAQTKGHNMTLAVRSDLPSLSLVPAIRKAVADIDRDLPLARITTQKRVIDTSLAEDRLNTYLCSSFAVLAVFLSCIGLYGIMAYTVVRQTGEIGIRKALGASSWDVARPILRDALILTAIGVAIGLPVAQALVRVIRGVFYDIEPHDPLTMVGAAVLMVVVAVLSAWIPANRAAAIDPMEALRCE